MESDVNNDNAGTEGAGAPAAPAEMKSAKVLDVTQQMTESISRYFQTEQRTDETLGRSMDEPSDKIWDLERKIADVRRLAERSLDLIRNYRY